MKYLFLQNKIFLRFSSHLLQFLFLSLFMQLNINHIKVIISWTALSCITPAHSESQNEEKTRIKKQTVENIRIRNGQMTGCRKLTAVKAQKIFLFRVEISSASELCNVKARSIKKTAVSECCSNGSFQVLKEFLSVLRVSLMFLTMVLFKCGS